MDNPNIITILVGILATVIGLFLGSKFLGKKKIVAITEPEHKPIAPEVKEKTDLVERIIEEEKKKVNSSADKMQEELNKIKDIPDEKERLEKLAELANRAN
jgi:Skp family chaperone for outer membrane proteins